MTASIIVAAAFFAVVSIWQYSLVAHANEKEFRLVNCTSTSTRRASTPWNATVTTRVAMPALYCLG